jgi:PAS domain-containing protein
MRPVPLTDWVVVASLPEDETLQVYRDTRNRALAAALAVLAVVALAAWRVARGIVEPMHGLAAAARGVAAGNDAWRAPEAGPREMAEVAQEFNRMVAANAAARDQLRAGEQHYRTLIQNLPVAVVAHLPDSAIEVFNDRACALLRMTPAQMAGRTALDRAWCFVDAQGQRMPPAAYPVTRLLQTQLPLPAHAAGHRQRGTGRCAAAGPHLGDGDRLPAVRRAGAAAAGDRRLRRHDGPAPGRGPAGGQGIGRGGQRGEVGLPVACQP